MGDGQATRLGEEAGFLSPLRRSGAGKGKKGAGRRWRRRRKSLEIGKGEEGVPEKAKLKSAGKEGRGGGKTDFPLSRSLSISLSHSPISPRFYFFTAEEKRRQQRETWPFFAVARSSIERETFCSRIYIRRILRYILSRLCLRERDERQNHSQKLSLSSRHTLTKLHTREKWRWQCSHTHRKKKRTKLKMKKIQKKTSFNGCHLIQRNHWDRKRLQHWNTHFWEMKYILRKVAVSESTVNTISFSTNLAPGGKE